MVGDVVMVYVNVALLQVDHDMILVVDYVDDEGPLEKYVLSHDDDEKLDKKISLQ